jgi:PTS system mannose-specific IIA component
MIGVVIVAHFGLAEKFVDAATEIAGKQPEHVVAVGIDRQKDVQAINQDITNAIKQVGGKDGVLILTDMFGGTPCNMSLPFLKEGRVEVITGLNLPMLIEVLDGKHDQKSLAELAQSLLILGQKNICMASEILSKKPTSG